MVREHAYDMVVKANRAFNAGYSDGTGFLSSETDSYVKLTEAEKEGLGGEGDLDVVNYGKRGLRQEYKSGVGFNSGIMVTDSKVVMRSGLSLGQDMKTGTWSKALDCGPCGVVG